MKQNYLFMEKACLHWWKKWLSRQEQHQNMQYISSVKSIFISCKLRKKQSEWPFLLLLFFPGMSIERKIWNRRKAITGEIGPATLKGYQHVGWTDSETPMDLVLSWHGVALAIVWQFPLGIWLTLPCDGQSTCTFFHLISSSAVGFYFWGPVELLSSQIKAYE